MGCSFLKRIILIDLNLDHALGYAALLAKNFPNYCLFLLIVFLKITLEKLRSIRIIRFSKLTICFLEIGVRDPVSGKGDL